MRESARIHAAKRDPLPAARGGGRACARPHATTGRSPRRIEMWITSSDRETETRDARSTTSSRTCTTGLRDASIPTLSSFCETRRRGRRVRASTDPCRGYARDVREASELGPRRPRHLPTMSREGDTASKALRTRDGNDLRQRDAGHEEATTVPTSSFATPASARVLDALTPGVPMVLLPYSADQPENAAPCAALGVAEVPPLLEMDPASLRKAIDTVLADDRYPGAARGLRPSALGLLDPNPGTLGHGASHAGQAKRVPWFPTRPDRTRAAAWRAPPRCASAPREPCRRP